MSAVGLFSPIQMLITAVSLMISGGSVILCGKYLGQNRQKELQNVFSLNLLITALLSALFIVLFLILGLFDLTGFFSDDAKVRPLFNRYLLGQSIGVFPLLVGNQLPAFLQMENKGKRTMTASLSYIVVNLVLNFLFVQLLHWEAFGLALASSLGLWVFFGVEAQYFHSGKSHLRLRVRSLRWAETGEILKTGLPGAASNGYQTLRSFLLNKLIVAFVGSVGISAFAAANNLLGIVWALPSGMLAVSRLMMSVSIGEEDRRTLTDVMRVMVRRFLPLMGAVCALIIVCAEPLTRIFYRDPAEPVYMMTVWGLRLLPLCMPLSIVYMHFVCYGQASGKQVYVHVLSALDGVVCVVVFAALTIRMIGMNGVYLASFFNGIVTTIFIVGYAWLKKKGFPRRMDELMVIPADFGAPESDRMDLSVTSIEEVVCVAERIQRFCLAHGIDRRRAYLAGLSMEEMAGNIVQHGFAADSKSHSVDVRVVHKDSDVILRIKDDCRPFDPSERQQLAEDGDPAKNIGIRMIFKIARSVQYQVILGLNVLTIRI
ncbi:MAG: ATP-binding protein [Oscillospiraceae bacterium]|nr:ATP-binding protein [Oscillospiraceae bacterium]